MFKEAINNILDMCNINTNNFKEINEWLDKVKTMYIFN